MDLCSSTRALHEHDVRHEPSDTGNSRHSDESDGGAISASSHVTDDNWHPGPSPGQTSGRSLEIDRETDTVDTMDDSAEVAYHEYLEQIQREIHNAHISCSICTALCELLASTCRESDTDHDLRLSIEQILALDCAAHHEFFDRLKSRIVQEYNIPELLSCPLRVYSYGDYFSLFIAHEPSGMYQINMGLVRNDDPPNHPGTWRRSQNSRFSNALALRWKNACIAEHGDECGNPWGIQATRPLWLIDTHRRCLVPGTEGGRYICLSYRWGTPMYRTRVELLGELQQPGYFDQPRIRSQLPLIISHAMQLVADLNERYLWADTLCIAQNDASSMAAELDNMGKIYGSAFLTIVAADGDGDVGLPGLSADRDLDLEQFPFGNQSLIQLHESPNLDPTTGTEYDGRAWTFQEYQMASRKLIFANNRIYWQCTRVEWDEQLTTQNQLLPPPSFTPQGLPDLVRYSDIVFEYSKRQLSFEADALRAISGMLTVLKGFEGGFLFGLPILFFDAALCWRPFDPSQIRRRKLPKDGSSDVVLPSWSWVGWKGRVHCCGDESGLSGDEEGYMRTYATTTWYTSPTSSGRTKHPISSWFQHRHSHDNPDGPLPSGWKRHESGSLAWPSDKEHPQYSRDVYVFEHERLGGRYFWHPFPVSDREYGQSAGLAQMPYLLGRTTRAWLEAQKPGQKQWNETVHFYDQFWKMVGYLTVDDRDEPLRVADEGGPGTKVELTAICRREKRGGVPGGDFADFYAVLWVEWEEGVAYRKGSGTVERSYWEAHPTLDTVELVLG